VSRGANCSQLIILHAVPICSMILLCYCSEVLYRCRLELASLGLIYVALFIDQRGLYQLFLVTNQQIVFFSVNISSSEQFKQTILFNKFSISILDPYNVTLSFPPLFMPHVPRGRVHSRTKLAHALISLECCPLYLTISSQENMAPLYYILPAKEACIV